MANGQRAARVSSFEARQRSKKGLIASRREHYALYSIHSRTRLLPNSQSQEPQNQERSEWRAQNSSRVDSTTPSPRRTLNGLALSAPDGQPIGHCTSMAIDDCRARLQIAGAGTAVPLYPSTAFPLLSMHCGSEPRSPYGRERLVFGFSLTRHCPPKPSAVLYTATPPAARHWRALKSWSPRLPRRTRRTSPAARLGRTPAARASLTESPERNQKRVYMNAWAQWRAKCRPKSDAFCEPFMCSRGPA